MLKNKYNVLTRSIGIIRLVRKQNFPKNLHFLPSHEHTHMRWGKKC